MSANESRPYQLHNAALEGIDPNCPNLTAEQKAAILEECRINPDYYFGAVCTYPVSLSTSYAETRYGVSRFPMELPKEQAQIITYSPREISHMQIRLRPDAFLDPVTDA